MRTTLDIPEDIFNEAKDLMHFKSKTDVIIHALKEYIRHSKLEKLTKLEDVIDIEIDLKKQRRRK